MFKPVLFALIFSFTAETTSALVVPAITSDNPRLLISTNELAVMQDRIDNQTEPYYSAWTNMKRSADIYLGHSASPYIGTDSATFYDRALLDGTKAMHLALAWHGTGNSSYAQKARDFIYSWATASPTPGNWTVTTNNPSAGMHIARGITLLIQAYDLIQPSLSSSDDTTIKNWFSSLLTPINQAIQVWHTNGYFDGQLYQNHCVAHTLAYCMIGYATGNRDAVQFALSASSNPRDMEELLTGTILVDDDSVQLIRNPDDPDPQAGEIYDRYRHWWHTGGLQLKGLMYSQLSMTLLTMITETAYQNGINFYDDAGANGEYLEDCFAFYSDFVRTQDSSIKGGFYTGEDSYLEAHTWYSIIYEIANKRYPHNYNVERLLGNIDRLARANDRDSHLCYPLLTHGADLTFNTYSLGEFESSADNWTLGAIVDVIYGANVLYGEALHDNPRLYQNNITNLNINTEDYKYLTLQMKTESGTSGNLVIYWGTDENPGISGDRCKVIPLKTVGTYQTYEIYMADETTWSGTLSDIRLDPLNGTANTGKGFWLDYIRLEPWLD